MRDLLPAEEQTFRSPIPTRPFSSDEFMPASQSEKQREFGARIRQYGEELAAHGGLSRRCFFRTAAGEIPLKFGVNNGHGDLGQIFAQTTMAEPRLAAALMGILMRGLGPERILRATDAVWTGSPQW